MLSTEEYLPVSKLKGFVPTLNNNGYMWQLNDPYMTIFFAESCKDKIVAEIGCAYGDISMKALEQGLSLIHI